MKLSDGSRLSGMLHPSIGASECRRLVGRTLDLEAAYKQVLVSKSSLWTSVLAIEDLQGAKRLFISKVAPFGASASVYGFNRLSRAIQLIGERLFGLIWNCYYDDFPQLDLACSGDNAQATAERLLTLLGWRFSAKDSKRQPMNFSFDVLGVTFDFSHTLERRVIVRDKASRIRQLHDEIDDILALGELSPARASQLRGKLQFIETHTFGRVLASNLQRIQMRACNQLPGKTLNEDIRCELFWVKSFLLADKPRTLVAGMRDRRLIIFTDASLENEDAAAGVGMVAYLMDHGMISEKIFFCEKVPSVTLGSGKLELQK